MESNSYFLLTIFAILFAVVSSLFVAGESFFYSYIFLHRLFLRRQLISSRHNNQEYKDLLESLLSSSFEDSIISDSLLNDLKLDLSPDEYQCLRFRHKENITYKELITFVNDYDSIYIDKIKQEQMTIIKKENMKVYG